jgi:DNA replication and repair protein RecF
MRLTHLARTDFRNFSRLDVDVPQGTILVTGDNAQGKTSLLEAIYYLAALISFHASSDRQVINFIAARHPLAVGRIVGEFERNADRHRIELRIIQEANSINGSSHIRKEVLLDGIKVKAVDAAGQFKAVLFLPQTMDVVVGAPEERRRYINLALTQVIPHYASSLADYSRALSQRNALLKQIADQGSDPDQLDFWDELLVSSGSKIIEGRIRSLTELERLATRQHRELTQSSEVLRLNYQPSYDPLPQRPGQFIMPLDAPIDRSSIKIEQIRAGFLEQLQQIRPEEISRGVTTIGPHRDELRFLSNGMDLGYYGSRGQVRTAMLALKLAEVSWVREKTGYNPVLLLDEVLAELDTQRRADLLERLGNVEQALLTTTDITLFSQSFVQQATHWKVKEGRLV